MRLADSGGEPFYSVLSETLTTILGGVMAVAILPSALFVSHMDHYLSSCLYYDKIIAVVPLFLFSMHRQCNSKYIGVTMRKSLKP